MRFIFMLIVSVSIFLSGCAEPVSDLEGETKEMIVAHNQPTDHPIHISLVEFQNILDEKSDGTLQLNVYANEQLGSERETIEMTQTNAIQFAKVSASALESFSESYALFSMPYLFDSQESYRDIMKMEEVQESFFETTVDNGFLGLTYYDAGVRNMYTVDRHIESVDDMSGLRTRVQPSQTSVQMIEAIGGMPTPMSYGEVYTALQSGILDAAENNETALVSSNHGEVAQQYFYTEHAIVPDILIMNKEAYDMLNEEERQWLEEAARESTEYHEVIWDEEVESSIQIAEDEMNVDFYEVDKSSFIEAVQPLQEDFRENEATAEQFELIMEEQDR